MTTVMAVNPMAMAEDGSEVTLAIPPPTAMVEEKRETGLPALPGGGTHGSPSWSELEGSGGDVARLEAEHLPVGHEVEVVEIPALRRHALGWSRQPSRRRRS